MTDVAKYSPLNSITVLIYETEHYEVIANLIKLFSFNNNCITCIISSTVHEKLNEIFTSRQALFNAIVIPPEFSRFKAFLLFQKTINRVKPGLIYLSTISSNHLLFAMLLKRNRTIKNILTIHDINCLFQLKPQPGIKNFIRFIGKRRLVNAVHEFNVIADTMVISLQQKLNKPKPVHIIPGAVFGGQYKPIPLQQSIKLVVPGTIDAKRRNYEEIFELLFLAEKNNLALEIYFAGGYTDSYGYKIIEQAKHTRLKICKIYTYNTEGLTQALFDECLMHAHFIYMPCVVQTSICTGIEETYGISKSSGNISDAIQFAKPFIAPAALKIPAALNSSYYKYSSTNQIVSFLSSLLQKPSIYEQLCNTALSNAQQYTAEAVRAANPSVFYNTLL
jgi:hypothetical protein